MWIFGFRPLSRATGSRTLRAVLVAPALALCEPEPVDAATRQWTGASTSGNWSAAANWSPAGAPANGDDLLFLSPADLLTTNDLVNLRVNSVTFDGSSGGFFLRGNPITLSNGITAMHAVGVNTVALTVTNVGAQTFNLTIAAATLDLTGDINLNGNLTFNNAGPCNASGVIRGTGNLVKNGVGTLTYAGGAANTYTGTTTVNAGMLALAKPNAVTAVPGNLLLGDGAGTDFVFLMDDNQIADTANVTIGLGSRLEVNSHLETIAALSLQGGGINTGSGRLTLGGNVTNLAASTGSFINGNLGLGAATRTIGVAAGAASPDLNISGNISGSGSAGLIITGEGQVYLGGNNTYGGTTTINRAEVHPQTDTAFGNVNGGVILNQGSLRLSNGSGVDINEALVVNGPGTLLMLNSGPSSWSGPVTLNTDIIINNANTLAFSNSISGPGGITFTSLLATAVLRFAGTNNNDYAGPTIARDGRLELAKTAGAVAVSGASLQIGDRNATNEVRLLASNQIAATVPITIYTNSTLNLNNFSDDVGSLTLNGGLVTTGTGTITPGDINFSGPHNTPVETSTISGTVALAGTRTWTQGSFRTLIGAVISGSGSLIRKGEGRLDLTGTNTFTGTATIDSGEIFIYSDMAFGSTAGGTIVNTNAVLTLAGVDVGAEPLTLREQARLQVHSGSNSWAGNVTLNNTTGSRFSIGGTLLLTGAIGGTGDLIKSSAGTLIMAGNAANTYVGDTFVNDGGVNPALLLNKSAGVAIPAGGTLYIGRISDAPNDVVVRLLAPNQLATIPVVITPTGILDLNGFNDTVQSLSLSEGRVTTGTGTISLAGSVTTPDIPSLNYITGRLNLGSAMRTFDVTGYLFVTATIGGTGGIIKEGLNSLRLTASNSYSGLTLINDGLVIIDDPFALGSTNSGTICTNGPFVRLILANVQGGLEPLTLGGTLESCCVSNTWAGNITLANQTWIEAKDSVLNLSGSISGPGNLAISEQATVILSGGTPNSYGDTIVWGTLRLEKTIANGAIPADLDIYDGILSEGVVQFPGVSQIADTSHVNIHGPYVPWTLNGAVETVGSVEGSGSIDLGNGILQAGANNASTLFTGNIFGSGQVVKRGTGTWTVAPGIYFDGNEYTGVTTVTEGTLIVNGNQPQSPVTVQSAGTLGGTGVVGNVVVLGTLAPGNSVGMLTCSNLTMAFPGRLAIDLDGDVFATRHDQVNVLGTVDLAGPASATLNVAVTSGFAPTLNQNLDIILNDGADPVADTFSGMPANAVFTRGGLQFRISYAAGDGNDIHLTVVSNALRLVTIQGLGGGNRNGAWDPNECDTLNTFIVTNVSPDTVTGVSATLVPRTPGIAITQPWSNYPDIPAGTRATNRTPFQISILPSFQCGTNDRFDLILDTASHGQYRLPFGGGLDDSGEEGALVRFDNNGSSPIPDNSTLNSIINVTGIATRVRNVVVSLHVTHTTLEDLDISLISPGGISVNLSSDNGGTASDYGTSCLDAQRTRFEANAASLISTSSPPYVGTFRPEGSLANFFGEVGGDVNGTWTLRIVDDTAGGVGTLRCWSLFIAPTVCPPGTGPCESCPDRTIYGYVNQGSPTMPRILLANYSTLIPPTTCASNKPCPGSTFNAQFHFDAYTFVNGESNACITVGLEAHECDLFSAAYRTAFNPLNVCENYLADMGWSTAASARYGLSNYFTYSFQANARERFVIVVNERVANLGCPYSLTVSGGSCHPVLDVERLPNNQVALDWSTAVLGYSLERTNNLGGPLAPAWLPAPSTPVISDSRFRLTNTVTGPANFYRLRKP